MRGSAYDSLEPSNDVGMQRRVASKLERDDRAVAEHDMRMVGRKTLH